MDGGDNVAGGDIDEKSSDEAESGGHIDAEVIAEEKEGTGGEDGG